MRRIAVPIALGLLLLVPRPATAQPYKDPTLPLEARVDDLLARMTPQEKFWQLFMLAGGLDGDVERYTEGAFGLQIGIECCRRGSRRARRCAAAALRRADAPGHPHHRLRRGAARPHPARRHRVPAGDRPRGVVRHDADARGRDGHRPGVPRARHPAGAVARGQHRERRALGSRRGDVRRGPAPRVRDGRRLRDAVRARRHHHHAQALPRQRRRRRPRQLSHPPERAAPARDPPAALRRLRAARRFALGDDGLQLARRHTVFRQRVAQRHPAQGRARLYRLRHLRRGRRRRRQRPALHGRRLRRGRRQGARRRPRRHLPDGVRPRHAVHAGLPRRQHPRRGDRPRRRARAARQVRAGPVREPLRRQDVSAGRPPRARTTGRARVHGPAQERGRRFAARAAGEDRSLSSAPTPPRLGSAATAPRAAMRSASSTASPPAPART